MQRLESDNLDSIAKAFFPIIPLLLLNPVLSRNGRRTCL